MCLDTNHEGKNCRFKHLFKCQADVDGSPCNGEHNTLLHNCGVAYCHSTAIVDDTLEEELEDSDFE